jgi:pyruvate dehydrogenase E2 component (dihydrolipoamide acetyltransferase)
MRRRIAERMHHAKATAAHFTFVEECDASRMVDLRQRLLPEAERRGVRLTFLPFIIKAVTEALRKHPVLNSALDERTNELVYKKYYNIGVATATEAGLMVPVVQSADRLRLFELAKRIERLSRAAQDGTLAPEDLRNSTFTVTSLGKQSGLLATPILNHPEVVILGVHRIKEKPVVRQGEIVVGKVMLLSLSLDHRIVDGHVGAAFAYDVIEALENPERLYYEYL